MNGILEKSIQQCYIPYALYCTAIGRSSRKVLIYELIIEKKEVENEP